MSKNAGVNSVHNGGGIKRFVCKTVPLTNRIAGGALFPS